MIIPITPAVCLTEIRAADKYECVKRINDREIYDRTLRIPHPYNEAHFDQWLAIVAESTQRHGQPVQFAIRESGSLIGALGFDELVKGHQAEIGYWLAKAWWGRGIMTAAVARACAHAFEQWSLVRITAHVFSSNTASARVLEKNGFQLEGLLRKHHLKDERFLDSKLYALVC
jgi:ribosomal-protein-alanine N-acetyltransferase